MEHRDEGRYDLCLGCPGLNTDSVCNINTFFGYLSWSITPHWDLSVMGAVNHDNDITLEGGDIQNNMFTIDLSYTLFP